MLMSDILLTAYIVGIESSLSKEYKAFEKYIIDGKGEMIEFV